MASSHLSQLNLLKKYIKGGDIAKAKQLLIERPDLCSSNAAISKGDTPLHVAARLGSSEMIRLLLEHSPIDLANNDGKTALHEAATHGRDEVVEVLLKAGAEINCLKAADWTPLMMACAKSHFGVVNLLLTAGASLTLVNKDGWNAFHIAAREGDVCALSSLLEADKNTWKTTSKNGRSPLHTAAINGKLECVQFLLSSKCGYQVDLQDSCGNTPLMDSLRKGFVNVSALLLKCGASLEATNSLGQSCLHVVAESGEITSLDCITAHLGVRTSTCINNPDIRGTTCLHLAAKEGHNVMVQGLLDAGADPFAKDPMDRTARDVAVLCKKPDCAGLLQL